MSQRQAAFAFGVSKSSLNDRLREKHSGKNIRDTLLLSIILFMADIGCAMIRLQIIDVVKNHL